MQTPTSSFAQKALHPVFQAAVIFAAILLFDLAAKLLQWAGVEIEQHFPWTIATAFLLFFAVWNAMVSILSANLEHYWGRSLCSFVVLAGLAGLSAWLFSSLSIYEAGSYRAIFFVLSICYLVFLSVIGFMKKIVEFAQKEEWNQPRLRKRKPRS